MDIREWIAASVHCVRTTKNTVRMVACASKCALSISSHLIPDLPFSIPFLFVLKTSKTCVHDVNTTVSP